ncbi:helix-turn-helix domain-containing protein [Clostridium estertheticum]|uniref:helix-turn-helix domain-containing protein n=1 Tax=Clostridium estertheticum TaxID=238834 RepID=UPI001CF140DC|nr:helix-turn-helix transcriptional regulator [Clostridium estertheticum]MCB2309025.1 helix-turn-helix domain-containing protein [Clostridium estertheticum]MCB2346841.1 helix-turn-helix domain-containing protein [Clostridium estertheticum]MCB2351847.1 helix-turn-helix domain-containing protein [Clostridium estertheticum]WAG48450.1 helix-turn-helix domain-containing protein [Clostridium estertheticum]
MDIKKVIANNICFLRTTNNLTQEQFANKLSVHFTRGHISRIETGGHVPSAEFIKCVSDAFDVKADWIIGSTGKEIPSTLDTPAVTNVTTREINLILNFRLLRNNVQNKILELIETILNSKS